MDNREAGASSDSRGGSETASCVRVVVRKQRRRGRASSPRRAAAATSPSPRRAAVTATPGDNCCCECGVERQLPPARPQHAAGDAVIDIPVSLKTANASVWNKLSTIAENGYFCYESEEEAAAAAGARLEVYRLQRGARLVAGAAPPAGPVERVARRARRRVRLAFQEVGGLLREVLALPGDAAAAAVGAVLGAARDWLLSGAQTTADLALKPALALLHNALLQPAAAATGAALGELRAALRPLWLLLSDALEPLVHILSAPRLITVQRNCNHV